MKLRGFRTWISDPRTGAAIAVSLIAAAVIAFVILSGLTARDALDARARTEAAAARRVDRLQDEIARLRVQLVDEVRASSSRIGELTDQIAVLQAQVRQLGGDPVVVRRSTTTTAAPRPPTTQRRPPPTTQRPPTTTPRRPTTTTTQPDRGLCVLVVCIGGTSEPRPNPQADSRASGSGSNRSVPRARP